MLEPSPMRMAADAIANGFKRDVLLCRVDCVQCAKLLARIVYPCLCLTGETAAAAAAAAVVSLVLFSLPAESSKG